MPDDNVDEADATHVDFECSRLWTKLYKEGGDKVAANFAQDRAPIARHCLQGVGRCVTAKSTFWKSPDETAVAELIEKPTDAAREKGVGAFIRNTGRDGVRQQTTTPFSEISLREHVETAIRFATIL